MTSPPPQSPSTPTDNATDPWHLSLPALPESTAATPFYEDEEQDAYPYHTDYPYQPPSFSSENSFSSSAGYSSSATEDEPEEPLTPTGMSPRRGKLRPFVLSPKAPMFAPQLLHQQQQQPQPQEMMMQEEYQGVPIIRQPIRRSHSAARLARQSRRSRTRTRGSKSLSPTPTLLIPAPATSGTSATKAPSSNTQEAMKLRLELDIDVHVNIKAKIHGDVTLSLLQ